MVSGIRCNDPTVRLKEHFASLDRDGLPVTELKFAKRKKEKKGLKACWAKWLAIHKN